MNDIAIKLENVSKFYKLYNSPVDRFKEALNPFGKVFHRDFYALNNINLEIKKGEILGVVGKNGCGKSTLLKLISKVLTPNEGNVIVKGKISALLELGSGFNPEFTGMQNIFFYGTILGFLKSEMENRLDEILAFADIGEFINQPIKTYSSGMKARLAFSVAIYVDPEILILDEVLSVGDMLFQRKCFMKMEELFNSNKTIIYVSHDIDSINRLCTRAVLLSQGNVVLDGKPKVVTAEYKRRQYENETVKKVGIVLEKSQQPEAISDMERDVDISLKTEVIVKEGSSHIDIQDYHILDKKGQRVNVLKCHECYTYVYCVELNQEHNGVMFGAGIRDKQGVPLSWTIEDCVKRKMEAGCFYRIEWKFTCRLQAGLYYMTAGARDSQGQLLRQELDTLVFKVEKNHQLNVGGVFDSSWECEIHKGAI